MEIYTLFLLTSQRTSTLGYLTIVLPPSQYACPQIENLKIIHIFKEYLQNSTILLDINELLFREKNKTFFLFMKKVQIFSWKKCIIYKFSFCGSDKHFWMERIIWKSSMGQKEYVFSEVSPICVPIF